MLMRQAARNNLAHFAGTVTENSMRGMFDRALPEDFAAEMSETAVTLIPLGAAR